MLARHRVIASVRLVLAVAVPLSIALLTTNGCGGGGSAPDEDGESVSAYFRAADGGSLEHPAGTCVDIPPNTLSDDCTVTITQLPPTTGISSDRTLHSHDA